MLSKYLKSLLLLSITLVAIYLSGCSKTSDPSSTQLEVTVYDASYVKVDGATVKLFKTYSDFLSGNNEVQVPKSTDVNGNVTFANLESVVYYVDVEKGSLTNWSD